jgi:hypothetical protein
MLSTRHSSLALTTSNLLWSMLLAYMSALASWRAPARLLQQACQSGALQTRAHGCDALTFCLAHASSDDHTQGAGARRRPKLPFTLRCALASLRAPQSTW